MFKFILFVIIISLIVKLIYLEMVIKNMRQQMKEDWQTMLDYTRKRSGKIDTDRYKH